MYINIETLKNKIIDNEYSNNELNNYLRWCAIKSKSEIIKLILSLKDFKYETGNDFFIKEIINECNEEIIYIIFSDDRFKYGILYYKCEFLNKFIEINNIRLLNVLIDNYFDKNDNNIYISEYTINKAIYNNKYNVLEILLTYDFLRKNVSSDHLDKIKYILRNKKLNKLKNNIKK